jgi:8-oxo-dGTP pyrophosphatase MutT (NUDIX family)
LIADCGLQIFDTDQMKGKTTKQRKSNRRQINPPSAIRHPPSPITYAAGGILWRKTRKGREVLLILRPNYLDWTLPKGHIEADDDGWDKAAQREVLEETGYATRITAFAGFTAYEVKRKPKVVFFWHMKPVGKANFQVSDEVCECRWFPVAEAIEKLTYDKDKELLRQFITDDKR